MKGAKPPSDTNISEKDGKLWAYVTADVTPMHKPRKRVPKAAAGEVPAPPAVTVQRIVLPVQPALPPVVRAKPVERVDPNFVRQVRQGRRKIDAKIDLHGMTQAQAHAALDGFINRAGVNNKRVLLVITGKGAGGEGVLRRNVPRWLCAHKDVFGVEESAIPHGGSGAFYVFLKKM